MILKSYSGIILFCSVFTLFSPTVKSSSLLHTSSELGISQSTVSTKQPSKECYCGTYSSYCFFKNGNKVCDCFPGYAQTSNSSYAECKECDCGSKAFSCNFDNDVRICSCPKGYSSESGKCEECDCGPNALSCKHLFSPTHKVCTCKEGYEPYGKLAFHDTCKKCDCGLHATSCKYKLGGLKECTCKPGYWKISGGLFEGDKGCKECDCGGNAFSCSFNSYGDKKCTCKQGYAIASYGVLGNRCKRCDCGPHSTSCSFTYMNKRSCSCEYGYRSKSKSSWDSDEECVPNGNSNGKTGKSSSWRIATYVMVGVFGVIILSLLMNISKKKSEWC